MKICAAESLSNTEEKVSNIEKYYNINISELNGENLFYSVVSKCREKSLFTSKELEYIDFELNRMIEETAKLCGKGYIKEENAKIMLKNIFMILNSVYSLSEFYEIIACVKEKRLWEMWQQGVAKSISLFDRTKKNFYHLEHFYYKNPDLQADFAIKLKNDYAFTNIYTHSFERALFTKAFFAVSENESFASMYKRSEILCVESAFLEKMTFEDLKPIIEERGYYRPDGGIKYTALLTDAIMLSLCYAAFCRCNGFYPYENCAQIVLSEIMNDNVSELEEAFKAYIHMAATKYDVKIIDKNESMGENILNVYASRVCDENIALLAHYLANNVAEKRKSEKGLRNLIHFLKN